MSMFAKMKQRREKLRSTTGFGKPAGNRDRAEWFNLKEPGIYGVYVLPLPGTRTDGELPYIPLAVHYRVGAENKMHLCLDAHNSGLWNKNVLAAIKRKNDRVRAEHPDWVSHPNPKDGCPTCEMLADPANGLSTSDMKDMRRQEKALFFVVPIWFDAADGGARKTYPGTAVQPFFASTKMADEIIDAVASAGIDIFDPEKAVLVQLKRVGRTWKDTRYSATLDVATATKPMKIHKSVRAYIGGMTPGGDHDPSDLVAGLTRDAKRVCEMLGISADGGDVETSAAKPDCFGVKEQIDPGDEDYCGKCPFRDDCAQETHGMSFDELKAAGGAGEDEKADYEKAADEFEPADEPEDDDAPADDDDLSAEFEAALADLED